MLLFFIVSRATGVGWVQAHVKIIVPMQIESRTWHNLLCDVNDWNAFDVIKISFVQFSTPPYSNYKINFPIVILLITLYNLINSIMTGGVTIDIIKINHSSQDLPYNIVYVSDIWTRLSNVVGEHEPQLCNCGFEFTYNQQRYFMPPLGRFLGKRSIEQHLRIIRELLEAFGATDIVYHEGYEAK